MDRFLGEAFEKAADSTAHPDLDFGDSEGEIEAAVFAVLPDHVYVVDANDLVAMDVDNLLVEQVPLEQEITLAFRQRGRTGGAAELQGAAGCELEMGYRDEGVAVASFG
jgi:hypothetical protein